MVQVEVPTRWDDHTAALWTLLDEPDTVAAALPGATELADDRVHLDLPSSPDVDLVWTRRHDKTSSVHELTAEVLSAPIRLRLDGRGTLRPDLSVDLSGLDAATGRQRRAWQSQVARQLAHVLLEVDLPQERAESDIATETQTEAQTEAASDGPTLPRANVAGPILSRLPMAIAAAGLGAVVAAVVTRWWPHRPRPGG